MESGGKSSQLFLIRITNTFHTFHAIFACMDMLLTQSFVTVADLGSITEAADKLGLTQSALSRRIQQLETQLGARLLERSRQGVRLTDIGELALEESRKLLRGFEALHEEIARRQGLGSGSVRIGGGATAVSFILPQAIAEFQTLHPGIHFQMKEAGSVEIAADVASGKLEIGIVTLPLRQQDLYTQALIDDDIVLVVRRNHPLARKKRIQANELAEQPFVSFEGGTALRKLIDSAVRGVGVDLNVVMELRSIPSILRMVATTGHLAFVSRLAAESDPDVIAKPVTGLRIQRRLALISRPRDNLSQAASAFTSLLLDSNER